MDKSVISLLPTYRIGCPKCHYFQPAPESGAFAWNPEELKRSILKGPIRCKRCENELALPTDMILDVKFTWASEEDAAPEPDETPTPETADNWAIVELMGHVRIAGQLYQEKRFGVEMGRLDIPTAHGKFVTQLFGGSAIYRITYTSEEVARGVAVPQRPVFALASPDRQNAYGGPPEEDFEDDFDNSDPLDDDHADEGWQPGRDEV